MSDSQLKSSNRMNQSEKFSEIESCVIGQAQNADESYQMMELNQIDEESQYLNITSQRSSDIVNNKMDPDF